MNRTVTHLAEKSIEYGFYLTHFWRWPNPCQPLDSIDLSWQNAQPEDFYAIPAGVPQLDFCTECVTEGSLRDLYKFRSSYASPFPENNTVHGLANLRREGQARAALIILHGHVMNSFSLLEYYARPAIRDGMDVYFMTLPYHMQRAPRGTWSGQYSLNSNIPGSAMAFMQGVRDVRSLISWIEAERRAPVVLAGISLGAFTACMTAVVDNRPKAVLSILGGGSLAQIIWDDYQLGRSKHQLQAAGVSEEDLERDWRLLGPANWQPKVARERVLMLAGEYDPIVTPSNTRRLWNAWGQPELHWYPAGHASILTAHRKLRQDIFSFLINCI